MSFPTAAPSLASSYRGDAWEGACGRVWTGNIPHKTPPTLPRYDGNSINWITLNFNLPFTPRRVIWVGGDILIATSELEILILMI